VVRRGFGDLVEGGSDWACLGGHLQRGCNDQRHTHTLNQVTNSPTDLDKGMLQVRSTLRRTRDGLTFGTPKTAASRRKVVLSPTAVAALRRHRARQEEERHAAGDLWQDLGLIFPNTLGRPMEPRDLLADVYRPLLKRAELPPVTFHAPRHTAARLLLAEDEHPKVVQELLGHAQVSITLDRYSRITPTLMSNAAQLMDRPLDAEDSPLHEHGEP
jgi:integrase